MGAHQRQSMQGTSAYLEALFLCFVWLLFFPFFPLDHEKYARSFRLSLFFFFSFFFPFTRAHTPSPFQGTTPIRQCIFPIPIWLLAEGVCIFRAHVCVHVCHFVGGESLGYFVGWGFLKHSHLLDRRILGPRGPIGKVMGRIQPRNSEQFWRYLICGLPT